MMLYVKCESYLATVNDTLKSATDKRLQTVYNLLSTESGKSFIEYREDHTPKPFASDELKMLHEEFQKVSNKLTTEQLL